MAGTFLYTRSASLPEITADSRAADIKQHIAAMKLELVESQRAGRQSLGVNLMPDVFAWEGYAQREEQTNRPTGQDDEAWKTVGEFFYQAVKGQLNLAFFSTYYSKDIATAGEFQAHAWVGIAAGADGAPRGWLTGAWDPDWAQTRQGLGPDQDHPGQATFNKLVKELPNMGFFLKRMDMSAYGPIWYGGGDPDDRGREPQDCSKACLAWLRQVCRGELEHRASLTDQTLELRVANLEDLGFEQIGKVDLGAPRLHFTRDPQMAPWVNPS